MICNFCKQDKDENGFLFRKSLGKRYGRCDTCRTDYNRTRKDYRSNWYKQNKERLLKKMKEYVEANKEEVKIQRQKARDRYREETQMKDRKRYASLSPEEKKRLQVKKYGITLEEYNQMFANQGYRCAICGSDDSKSKLDFCVDHCHNTGKVRGILCHGCNKGIGYFEDNLNNLESAIKYLQGHI